MYAYVLFILRQSVKEIVTTYNEILADYSADFGVHTFIRDARSATVAICCFTVQFHLTLVKCVRKILIGAFKHANLKFL